MPISPPPERWWRDGSGLTPRIPAPQRANRRRTADRTPRPLIVNSFMRRGAVPLLWHSPFLAVRVIAMAVNGKLFGEVGIADFARSRVEFADGNLRILKIGRD